MDTEPTSSPSCPMSCPSWPYPTLEERERQRAEAVRWAAAKADCNQIKALLQDSNADFDQISRLIARRMVAVILEMAEPAYSRPLAWLNAEIRALRMLQAAVRDIDRLQQRQDVLNINGRKFQTAYDFLLELFERAMDQAAVRKDQLKSVMMHFRDLIVEKEQELRRVVAEA